MSEVVPPPSSRVGRLLQLMGPSPGFCYCDESCRLLGDCCGDYEETCPGDLTTSSRWKLSGARADWQPGTAL